MQADLEFEYPHKLEKLLVRSEILSWLDEEEIKLQTLAKQQFEEQQVSELSQGRNTPGDDFYLTYDDYYGNQEEVQAVQRENTTKTIYDTGKISFEEFVKKNAS